MSNNDATVDVMDDDTVDVDLAKILGLIFNFCVEDVGQSVVSSVGWFLLSCFLPLVFTLTLTTLSLFP